MDELSGSQEVDDVGDGDGLNEKDRWISSWFRLSGSVILRSYGEHLKI